MRRFFTAICALPILALLLIPSPAQAQRKQSRHPVRAIQATDSAGELVLLSRTGWAKVRHDGRRRRVRLTPDERLTSIVESRNGWVVGGVRGSGDASQIFFVTSPGGRKARLPELSTRSPVQLRPVPLTHDGTLTGAAWLEGISLHQLAVKYADWNGVAWGPVTTISAPGPGSQTGLTGATLENGDTILVWSRFDGTDDEIFEARREGAAWTAARRVGPDNETPDITPVLAASQGAATLVWAGLDQGQYRLFSRELTTNGWRKKRPASERGAAFPTLVKSRAGVMVVYRTAVPLGWTVRELGGSSAQGRTVRLTDTRPERPVLELGDRREPGALASLRWFRPGRKRSAAWLPQ